MKTLRYSATDARNNFFRLLNEVLYNNVRVVIDKADAEGQVVMEAKQAKDVEIEARLAALRKIFGSSEDVSEEKFTDDRLRGKKSGEYLKRAREGNV